MIGARDLALGIDIGTSGVRVAALDPMGSFVAKASATMPKPDPSRPAYLAAWVWWHATETALKDIAAQIDLASVAAFAVDGTSGTLLAIDDDLQPVAPPSMYNDVCAPETLSRIAGHAPRGSAALGATSALGRAIELQAHNPEWIVHQADWIASLLTGQRPVTDENNALKTGYDPVSRCWPDWLAAAGLDARRLPRVVAAGSTISQGGMSAVARQMGFAMQTCWVAGTTDGCAAFLATGAGRSGEAVTSLGSTLVLKLLSDRPLFAPEYGIYSHRMGDMWLAGGASNSGGAALLRHFTPETMRRLESHLDPGRPTGLDYYPLPAPGERFPINDAKLEPRVIPRPSDDAVFLQGLLEGIASVEAMGYRRLAELGAPPLVSVRSVGGGAANKAWTAIRQRLLGVPFESAQSEEAAAGVARLALAALQRSPA